MSLMEGLNYLIIVFGWSSITLWYFKGPKFRLVATNGTGRVGNTVLCSLFLNRLPRRERHSKNTKKYHLCIDSYTSAMEYISAVG